MRQANLDPLPADHDRAPDGHPPPDGEQHGQLWWPGRSGAGSAKPVPGRQRERAGDGADYGAVSEDVPDRPVFGDPRFQLASGPDEVLLGFLAQVVHPVVRPDTDRARTSSLT